MSPKPRLMQQASVPAARNVWSGFHGQGGRKTTPAPHKMQIGLRWPQCAWRLRPKKCKRGSARWPISGASIAMPTSSSAASRSPRMNFRSSALSARVLPRLDAGARHPRCVQVTSCYGSKLGDSATRSTSVAPTRRGARRRHHPSRDRLFELEKLRAPASSARASLTSRIGSLGLEASRRWRSAACRIAGTSDQRRRLRGMGRVGSAREIPVPVVFEHLGRIEDQQGATRGRVRVLRAARQAPDSCSSLSSSTPEMLEHTGTGDFASRDSSATHSSQASTLISTCSDAAGSASPLLEASRPGCDARVMRRAPTKPARASFSQLDIAISDGWWRRRAPRRRWRDTRRARSASPSCRGVAARVDLHAAADADACVQAR